MTNKYPKRLLIAFHDLGLGGIQKKVVDICWYLYQHHPQFKVRIALRRRLGIFLSELPPNVVISAPHRPLYRLGTPRFLLWMVKEIIFFRPTHILTFMDFSAIPTLAALNFLFWKKIPVTIGEDILTSKYLTDLYGPSQAPIRQKLIEKYYPQARRILVQTPVQKKDLQKILKLINSSRIISTPNWLSLNYPPSPAKALAPAGRDIDILYVGRIAAQKNLTRFIQIIKLIKKQHPAIKSVIVGDGEEFNKIKQLIVKYKLTQNITLVGSTTNPQSFYLRAKNFLLTSDYEGFPLTLMEAISCGCRPVSTELPEIRQFFDRQPEKYLYSDINTAVQLLLSTPHSLPYYRRKLIKLQIKNIQKYINFCLN